MLTSLDKAWVGGLAAFIGHLLQVKLGLAFVTPELIALVTGVLIYWVPNKAAPDVQQVPPPPAL